MTKPYKNLLGGIRDKMSLGDLVVDDRILLKSVLKLREIIELVQFKLETVELH